MATSETPFASSTFFGVNALVCVCAREREGVCCLTLPDAAIVAIVVAAILAQQKLNGAVKCNHCGV